ncbi:unnamed protein product [Blepharisma stoltei]|uniref:CCT domain-containing protein n=1 Tax=Blepharisma stoltei TaxID=1481888 RepID=A0AAU9JZD3_9CILI|nr:unnamed protein product [Blepharisma stoltei]
MDSPDYPLDNKYDADIAMPIAIKPVTHFLLIPASQFLMNPDNSYLGSLTKSERANKVKRYLEKKHSRVYDKKVRYQSRKDSADKRTRVCGRFVKQETPSRSSTEDEISMACFKIDSDSAVDENSMAAL